jgi:hypothetical protein
MVQLATRERERAADDAVAAPASGLTWVRAVGAAALGQLTAGYALCAALVALVVAVASHATLTMSDVFGGAVALWLAANHVQLVIVGKPLGVLPLLLLVPIVLFVAKSAAATAERVSARTPHAGAVIVAAFAAVQGIVGAVFASIVSGAVSVSGVQAFFTCAVVGGLAAAGGVAKTCGFFDAASQRLDAVTVLGIKAARLAFAGLVTAGAVTFAVTTALSFGTGRALFDGAAPGIGSGIGLLLLCAIYLPNAVIGALSFAAGPGVSVGQLSLTPIGFHGGAVPAMPLLSSLPDGFAPWWPAFLVLPLAFSALFGYSVRNVDENPVVRLRVVGIAAVIASIGCLVLGALAGGTLGDGAFSPVLVPSGALALAGFGWIAVVGGAVAWFAGPRPVKAVEDSSIENNGVFVTDDAFSDEDDEDDFPDDASENDESEADAADAEDTELEDTEPDEAEPDEDHEEDTEDGETEAVAGERKSPSADETGEQDTDMMELPEES